MRFFRPQPRRGRFSFCRATACVGAATITGTTSSCGESPPWKNCFVPPARKRARLRGAITSRSLVTPRSARATRIVLGLSLPLPTQPRRCVTPTPPIEASIIPVLAQAAAERDEAVIGRDHDLTHSCLAEPRDRADELRLDGLEPLPGRIEHSGFACRVDLLRADEHDSRAADRPGELLLTLLSNPVEIEIDNVAMCGTKERHTIGNALHRLGSDGDDELLARVQTDRQPSVGPGQRFAIPTGVMAGGATAAALSSTSEQTASSACARSVPISYRIASTQTYAVGPHRLPRSAGGSPLPDRRRRDLPSPSTGEVLENCSSQRS